MGSNVAFSRGVKLKKAILVAFLCAVVLIIAAPPHGNFAAGQSFSGSGSGTAGDPYMITTVGQLQEMKNNLSAHYALGNDINASDTVNWNGGAGFEPVGTYANGFTGSFDGRGYKINNLYINRSGTDGVGLFERVSEGGVVKNVGLENVYVTGHDYVGGLVGRNEGTVSNSYSTGSVGGNWYVGGLVGRNSRTVSNCYSTGSVSSSYAVGGLVGTNDGTVSNSYSTGLVSGSYEVGGLVGRNDIGTVSNCYSAGDVNGAGNTVGGLVGFKYSGTVSNSFWDKQTSGQATSDGGIGKTTAEMKTQSTFTNVGWDFVNIWNIASNINSGYPFLALPPPTTITTPAPPPETPYAIYVGVILIVIVIVGLVTYLLIRRRRRGAGTIRR